MNKDSYRQKSIKQTRKGDERTLLLETKIEGQAGQLRQARIIGIKVGI
jgi:hypothetical protein